MIISKTPLLLMQDFWNIENYRVNLYVLPFFIASVLMLFLGIYIFMYGGRGARQRSFLGICITFFLWLFGTTLVFSAKRSDLAMSYLYLTYAGGCFISVSLYSYASVWIDGARRSLKYIVPAYLLGTAFLFLVIFTKWVVFDTRLFFWGYHSQLTPVGGIAFLCFFFVYLGFFFKKLFKGYRQEKDIVQKRQIRLVGISFFVATIGSSDLLPCLGYEVFPLGGLTMCGAVSVVGYTIVKYKLLDIETVIHKTLMWMLTSFVLGVPLVLFFYFYKDWVHALPAPAYLGILIVSFLTVVIYGRTVQPNIDHFFQKRQTNLNRALELFTDKLVHLIDLKQVAEHILATLKDVLYVENASVLIREGDTSLFKVMTLKNLNKSRAYQINADLLEQLEKSDKVLARNFVQGDPSFDKVRHELGKFFEGTQVQICVPLTVHQKLIGILNIGQKQNLQSFRTSERTFLADLRRNTAIVLSNALQMIALQENLKKWNVELERKVEERTAQLKGTQAQLVQAEKMATIGILAGGVAHEINNPLMAVLSNANFLKQTAASEDMKPISLIEAGAKRCQVIVNSLLKYSRKPEAEISFVDTDLNAVVKSACSFLDYQMKQENVEVRLELGEISVIRGISNELEQVITNLVVNAKDAAVKNERPAQIILKTTEEDQNVVLTVHDNGEGMSKKIMGKIFDPFFTTKDVGGGTGLGLAVTYTIIQKHHGEIKVFSEEGVGTTFTVKIPLAAEGSRGKKRNIEC